MTDPLPLVVTDAELATFMNTDVDTTRAKMMIDLAKQACSTIVSPLTPDAKFAVLSVAARVYANPVPIGSQSVGPYAVGGVSGGITLTRGEEKLLRRLTGGGGAFSIDPLPADAGQNVPWWDSNGFVPTP